MRVEQNNENARNNTERHEHMEAGASRLRLVVCSYKNIILISPDKFLQNILSTNKS